MEKDLPSKGVWSNTVNTILEDILTSVAFAEKTTTVNIIFSCTQESTRGVVFLVNFCGKEFQIKQRKCYHESEHTGIYRFSCQECGKGFNEKSLYLKHRCV